MDKLGRMPSGSRQDGAFSRALADAIEAERARVGMTVTALAERSGIKRPTLYGLLRHHRVIDVQQLYQLCDALELNIEDLVPSVERQVRSDDPDQVTALRKELVGRTVLDTLLGKGMGPADAVSEWPIALPTLNRLIDSGDVGVRFYALAERKLGLPRGLLAAVVRGDAELIGTMTDLDSALRERILRELEGGAPTPPTTQRKHA